MESKARASGKCSGVRKLHHGEMSFPAPLILALSEADSPMLLWLIVGALMALGPVIHSYIKVYEWFRGKSIDTSAFVTRDELTAMKQERDAQIASSIGKLETNFSKLETLLADLNREMPSLHRALGRLEGHDEAEGKRRPR